MTDERLGKVLDRYQARVLEFDRIAERVAPSSLPTTPVLPSRSPEKPTGWEIQILGLVAAGLSNTEVATRLFLSEDTIKTHLVNMRRKLHARNRAHAVAIAFQRGLLPTVSLAA